jgi:CSLREA domain-containing protein
MSARFHCVARRSSRHHSLLTLLLACAAVFSFTHGADAATAITGATNATPIVITSAAHGLLAGDQVIVTGVAGNTAANGNWILTVLDADRFSLNGSAGNGAYTGGGTWTKADDAFTSLVVTHTADTDDGACDATCSLREAVAAANADAGAETITFVIPTSDPGYDAANDLYTITLIAGQLVIPDGRRLRITGLGADRLAISGNYQSRVFTIGGGASVTLANLTIRDGWAVGCPGLSSFFGCGGGIANVGGTLNVSNSHMTANDGGLFGGAIHNVRSASLTVMNTLFSANTAATGGGGIHNDRSTVDMANATFSSNSSQEGGAIDNQVGGLLNISSSTFSGNAGFQFGVIFNPFNAVNLRNTIVTNSTGASCGPSTGTIAGSNNLIDDESCGSDPAFRRGAVTNFDSSLQDNGGPTPTHALLNGSNAIDAVPTGQCTYLSSGTNPLFANGAVIPTDQRGLARPQGSACDTGAFESEFVNSAPIATADAYTTNEDTMLTIGAPGVLTNDTDPDGDPLSAALVSGPSHGSLTLNTNGGFTYTPAVSFTGTDAFTYRASDGQIASNTVTVTITVAYRFSGFFAPVDNLPIVNRATGGQAIPVKFSLGGYQGLSVFAPGSPSSQPIPCSGGASIDDIPSNTAGGSGLQYDAASDTYTYVWKTEKSWKNTCRQLTIRLDEGSTRVLLFQFK